MKVRLAILRQRADQDAAEIIDHYLAEGAEQAALHFIDALERGFAHLGRYPGAGSLRLAHELDLPDVRVWPLDGCPYLVFYVERADHLDVWRVLHMKRDLPVLLNPDAIAEK